MYYEGAVLSWGPNKKRGEDLSLRNCFGPGLLTCFMGTNVSSSINRWLAAPGCTGVQRFGYSRKTAQHASLHEIHDIYHDSRKDNLYALQTHDPEITKTATTPRKTSLNPAQQLNFDPNPKPPTHPIPYTASTTSARPCWEAAT